jgi:hypothetical protein
MLWALVLMLPSLSAAAQEEIPSNTAQIDERQAELRQRALLGEQTPLERLTSPDAFPAGRDSWYTVGSPLLKKVPAGHELGGFVVGGYASSSVGYDSNVDAKSHGGGSDAVLATSTSVIGSPLLRRHSLVFLGSVTMTGVLPDVSKSDISWNLGAAGTLNLSRRADLDADLSYSRQIEGAGASNWQPGSATGTSDRISGTATYIRRYKRSSLSMGGGMETVAYENGSDNNYYRPSLNAGFGYALTPRLGLQIGSTLDQTIYPEGGGGTLDRDARTLTMSVTANFQPRPNVAASLSIGYQRTDFTKAQDSTSGVIFGASVNSRLNEATAASLRLSRSFDPTTTVQNAAGATLTDAQIGVQRSISLHLSGDVQVGLELAQFQAISRTDLLFTTSAGLSYALNDAVGLTLRYGYDQNFSDKSDAVYKRLRITAGIAVSF